MKTKVGRLTNLSVDPVKYSNEKNTLVMIVTDKKRFDLVVDGVPYSIVASPFSFNDELRYMIRINGGEEHVFTWDSEMGALRAIDDNAVPVSLEEALNQKLQAL